MIFFMVKVFRGFANEGKMNIDKAKGEVNNNTALRVFLLVVFIQFLAVEFIQRESIFETFAWLDQYYSQVLINFLLAALFSLFFTALAGSLRWGVIISTMILLIFSLTSLVKKQFLGDPLLPWDFTRYDQAFNLLPKIASEIVLVLIILGLASLLIILSARFLIPRYNLKVSSRILIIMIIIPILSILILYRHTPVYAAFEKMDIEHIHWVPSQNSLQNGFLLGFIMNIENGIIVEPEEYTEAEIRRIFSEYDLFPKEISHNLSETDTIKPNLIIVMNEAFWDPTILPDISFSQDPIPYFRELMENNTSGTLVSPVFGGSTANVEFEIMTGLSTAFLPTGSIAFEKYIQRTVPSLPQIFRDNGYVTTAIHPYHSWFYKRDEVYDLLGFDNFLSLKDFSDIEIKGEYIGDLEVSRSIIKQITSTDQPQLIFAVTMQNHGPYPEGRYESTDITITGRISSEGNRMLEVYSEGLKDADNSLKMLIDNFKQSDKPITVVFFGDHLPYLGKNYLVYKETGFIEDNENRWTFEENIRMKSVPLTIWSNYETNSQGFDRLGSSFLGRYLLELTNQDSNHIFRFTEEISKYLLVYDKTVSIDNSGKHYRQLPDQFQKLEKDYLLLQYDLLFGEEYYLKYITREG